MTTKTKTKYPGKPFFFLDPDRSFAPGSEGLAACRLQGPFGQRLGADAWELGYKAYELLRHDMERVTPGQFAQAADNVKQLMRVAFESIAEAERHGSLKLTDERGVAINVPTIDDDTDLVWQITTILDFMEAREAFADADAQLFLGPMVVGCLLALDEAVGWSFDDSAACSAALLDAARFMHTFEAVLGNEARATARLIVLEKERASARGRLRHAQDPKRSAKDFVRECWERWRREPAMYPTATAFARDMLEKQPGLLTSEIVVTRWVRAWTRESDHPTG